MARKELFAIELNSKDATQIKAWAETRNCSVSEVIHWLLTIVRQAPDSSNVTEAGEKTRSASANRAIARAKTAMRECVSLLYERDGKDQFVNFDSTDGRILIPMPWSRHSHAPYGLSDREHRGLRGVMVKHLQSLPTSERLFRLNNDRWFLNYEAYPSIDNANQWLSDFDVVPSDWLKESGKHNAIARQRRKGEL